MPYTDLQTEYEGKLNALNVAAKLAQIDNQLDFCKSQLNWLLTKAGSYTAAQIQSALGVSATAAAVILEHKTAFTNIVAAINAEVTAGRIPNGQVVFNAVFGG